MKPNDSGAIYSDGRFFDLESGDLTIDIPFYLYGDHKGGPFESNSRHQLIVCRLR